MEKKQRYLRSHSTWCSRYYSMIPSHWAHCSNETLGIFTRDDYEIIKMN